MYVEVANSLEYDGLVQGTFGTSLVRRGGGRELNGSI